MGAEFTNPADRAVEISPATDVGDFLEEIGFYPRGIYVGGGGDVQVQMLNSGTVVTFIGVQAGSVLPIRVKWVNVSALTATSLVALG